MLGPETGLRKAMDEANLDSGDRVALRQRGQLQVIRLNGRELISRLNTSSKLGRTVGRKLGTRGRAHDDRRSRHVVHSAGNPRRERSGQSC